MKENLIIIFFALILAIIVFAIKGLILAWLIVWGAKLFGHDLSEYFNFMWVAFAIFFLMLPSNKR